MGFWLLVEILGTLSAVTVLVIAATLEPDPSGRGTHVDLGLEPCSYLGATGKPCFSCGMTTSFSNMIRARPVAAVQAHPAGAVLFLVTLWLPLWLVHAAVTRRDPFRCFDRRWVRWFFMGLVGLIITVWIVRASA